MLFSNGLLIAQPSDLLNKLNAAQTDTAIINVLNELTDYYIGQKNDSANYYNQRSLTISTQKKIEKYNFEGYYLQARLKKINKQFDEALSIALKAIEIAKINNNTIDHARALILSGNIFESKSAVKQGVEKYLEAFELSKSRQNKKGMLLANIALGLSFKKHDELTNALKYFLEAMKLAEEIPDSSAIFTCCINLGTLYENTNDDVKALQFYHKASVINQRDNDENGQAICFFKIGRMYLQMNKIDSAKIFLQKTLEIHLKRNDEIGLIFDYSFMASSFNHEKNFAKADENWNKALALSFKHNDSIRINMVYSYMATGQVDRKNDKKALEYYEKSLQYICSTVQKETIAAVYEKMATISNRLGLYKQAYDYHVLYKIWADSSNNVNDTKKQTELKLAFEFNQVQEKIAAESEAKELKNKTEMEKQRMQRNFLFLGLGLISLLLVVAFRSFKMKQKANFILQDQKQEIEHQKKLVDEKNREISDSINYALRIQTASLPEKKELSFCFPEYSLFFKPKDIVSGDFYWAAGDENKVLIAIADCTGHGVPGAITSMMGSMILNEIYYVKKIIQPNEVLSELNRLVKLTLRQEADSLSKDGMDIAFCQWEKKTNTLLYSGANRPLYILRGNELIEYKPTKVSVGGYVPMEQQYELHEIILSSGDTVILSSDGYVDQFGGQHEKKYTSKAFKRLLKEIAHLDISEQGKMIEQNFNNWKSGFDQTDDVLIFMWKV
ncbi:MAG: hypothetical protein A3F72_16250 [Bacteroidetes bacterium RIFCSPLOWO2_12_FULL_35_15]|nr:MAG: hypothetical protein A3F72_16250 [Bacteroidetes bacterium RIFCSPLOWO2_12_FULL_35_15]